MVWYILLSCLSAPQFTENFPLQFIAMLQKVNVLWLRAWPLISLLSTPPKRRVTSHEDTQAWCQNMSFSAFLLSITVDYFIRFVTNNLCCILVYSRIVYPCRPPQWQPYHCHAAAFYFPISKQDHDLAGLTSSGGPSMKFRVILKMFMILLRYPFWFPSKNYDIIDCTVTTHTT